MFITLDTKNTFLLFVSLLIFFNCSSQIKTGSERLEEYLPLLKNKNVGVVAHNASRLNSDLNKHLVDILIENKINIESIFAPEHGYYSNLDNGDLLEDDNEKLTGIKIISLYGKTKKPLPKHLKDIDIILFDIQDVGARFYTFISTLHYVMEACAEENIPIIILDRPNPNGHYVDGPVLNLKYKTFVGMHPVPIVHGMTIGEYAKMINGEGWLKNNIKCDLKVIANRNYTHKSKYILPIRPSPNLPNNQAIYLYPSLCLLEPTSISVGRGTEKQFQIYGHPNFPKSNFQFKPKANFGSKNPKWKNQICYGVTLEKIEVPNKIELSWLIDAYNKIQRNEIFFKDSFERIAGNDVLREQIINKVSEVEIRKSWRVKLEKFKIIRKKYLLYTDFY